MQEAVHADTLLQTDDYVHIVHTGKNIGMQYRLEGDRNRTPVIGVLESSYRTYDNGQIDRIRLVRHPATQILVVNTGVKQGFLCILTQYNIHPAIRMVRQFFGRHAALHGPEAECFKEMGMWQKLNIHKVESHCITFCHQGGSTASLRTGIYERKYGSGLLYIGMLAGTFHDIQIRLHQRSRVGSLSIIARRLRLQHTDGHHAEAVGIVAKRKVTVVSHHNNRIEDNPRKNSDQYKFGQQPAIAAATGP